MKVRVIKSFEMDGNSLPIRAGEEYEVREYRPPLSLNPIFQIISGPRSGEKIPWDCCMELPKERTYTEAEYNAIRGQLDQAIEHKRFAESVANQKINECNKLRRQHNKAIDDLSRHAKELAALRQERQMLLETIEKAAGEQQLVELPREVAKAIEFLRDGGISDFGIVALSDQTPMLGRDYSAETIEHLRKIRSYPLGDKILKALVNGYTIEKTPEERLFNEIEEIILDWHEAPRGEVSVLTQRIVDHLKSIQT